MGEYFAAKSLNNSALLCVGEITRVEAARAREEGQDIDGSGYYLFLADGASPKAPVQILAKFFSQSDAAKLARLLGPQFDFS